MAKQFCDVPEGTNFSTVQLNSTYVSSGDVKLHRYGKLRILTGYFAPAQIDSSQQPEHTLTTLDDKDKPMSLSTTIAGRMNKTAGVIIAKSMSNDIVFNSNTTENITFNLSWIANYEA